MKDLIKKVEKLVDDVERLQSLQTGTGSGGGVSTASLPLAITGSNIALGITVANDGGAIVNSPASQQTGNINITGNITANGNATVGSVITSTVSTHSLTATSGPITSNGSLSAATTIQASTGPYFLGSVPILDSGGTFPSTGLLDGQRYWHNVYRSWFVYNQADAKWRQEGPGVFASTFPTVAAGDNTVAPQIQVTRLDRSLTYYYDGTQWLSTSLYSWSGPAISGITVTTLNSNITDFNEDVYSIYLTKFVFVSIMVGGTYNSTNTWTVQLKQQSDAAVVSNIGSAVDIWQTGRVVGRRYHNTLAINTVYAPATTKLFLMDLTKVSAAGTFVTESPTLWYRLVG